MNENEGRNARYSRYMKLLDFKTHVSWENEILWDLSGYTAMYPEIGQHLDYDMSAISRIYGVSIYTTRKALVDFLSRLGMVEMCVAYLRYLHDVYENPFGVSEGGLRL